MFYMTRTKWIIFILICFGILGFTLVTKKTEPTFTGDATKVISQGPIADRVYGSHDQKVILVEYGDFQCPACGQMYPTVKEIKETYKNQLTFVFRNMPLTSIHPNALAAATVAEAAGQQGKFFDMFDLLYQNQNTWQGASVSSRGAIFEGYAKSLGLNSNQFKNDLDSSTVSDKLARDHSTSQQFNVDATPTFILNGKKLPSSTALNAEALKKAVTDALQQAGYTLPPVTSTAQPATAPAEQ